MEALTGVMPAIFHIVTKRMTIAIMKTIGSVKTMKGNDFVNIIISKLETFDKEYDGDFYISFTSVGLKAYNVLAKRYKIIVGENHIRLESKRDEDVAIIPLDKLVCVEMSPDDIVL